MLGHNILMYINERLKQIKQCQNPFGNGSVLAVGTFTRHHQWGTVVYSRHMLEDYVIHLLFFLDIDRSGEAKRRSGICKCTEQHSA
jgi:hypothetical protein